MGERTHLLETTTALCCEGELVDLEDLVLHDAAADARAPSVAVTRAHAILRARRRLAGAPPGWALNPPGFDILRGANSASANLIGEATAAIAKSPPPAALDAIALEEDAFAAELADIDAILARSAGVLAGAPSPSSAPSQTAAGAVDPDRQHRQDERDSQDWHERQDRLATWREVLAATQDDPPVLAAARALAGFDTLAPLPNQAWLGRLVAADLLRARGKTRHHLAALNLGSKIARRGAGGRRPRDEEGRLAEAIATIHRAAATGLADHDRWSLARAQLRQKLVGRRSTSHLPGLIGLVLRAPVVSSATIAVELEISPRTAQSLIAELGLRELSGRTRYRCWGII